jgi:hypothetical protein
MVTSFLARSRVAKGFRLGMNNRPRYPVTPVLSDAAKRGVGVRAHVTATSLAASKLHPRRYLQHRPTGEHCAMRVPSILLGGAMSG